MKLSVLCTTAALLVSTLAVAAPEDKEQPSTVTGRLLAAQASGELASTEDQYLSGKVRKEVYQRYVKSFSHPIPARFAKDSFKSE